MKILKFLVKYSLIFVIVSVITTFVAIAGVTYYALDHLHQDTDNNHNLHEVLRIGENYVQELESFETLQQMLQDKKMAPFCKTLCNPTSLSQEQLLNQRTPYLTEFYKTAGPKAALQDPMFRFKIEQMSSVSRAVPADVRELMKDVLNKEAMNAKNKAWLAVRIETAMLGNLPSIPKRIESFKSESEKLTLVRAWMKACHSGTNVKKITSECEKEFSAAN